MAVTQAVHDNVRDRLLRWTGARGLSRVAAVVTLTVVAAGAASLVTPEAAGHGIRAGRLIATITKLTVSQNLARGSVVTLAAREVAVDGAHPAGWVQFEAGDTDVGDPVAVSPAGLATTTAAILGALPATTSVTAGFTPATTAYLASVATTTAAQTTGGTVGSIPITVTVPPTGAVPPAGTVTPAGTVPPAGTATPVGTATPTGNLTITVQPGTMTLQDVGRSGVATGLLQPITVTDNRSAAPGWYVLAQESDFVGGRGVRPRIIAATALGWVPNGTVSGGASLGPAVAAGHPGLASTGALLAAAAIGSGRGTSTLSADLTLAISASAAASPYIGTLTITCVEAGPQAASASQSPLPQAG
jgi:hypothetical protein